MHGKIYRVGDFVLVMVKPRVSKTRKYNMGKKRKKNKSRFVFCPELYTYQSFGVAIVVRSVSTSY